MYPGPDEELAFRISKGVFLDEKGRLDGLTPMTRRTLIAFLENGGDKYEAVRTTRRCKTEAGVQLAAKMIFRLPQAKAFLRREMTNVGLVGSCIETWQGALKAERPTIGGKMVPDWNARLRAADLVMKACGFYDKEPAMTPKQEKLAEAIDIDWSETDPDTIKRVALTGQWPQQQNADLEQP